MNRTFTDQVAGNDSSLKHSIGDEQEQDEIVKLLKNLRKAVVPTNQCRLFFINELPE
jgi:hypothetical protein